MPPLTDPAQREVFVKSPMDEEKKQGGEEAGSRESKWKKVTIIINKKRYHVDEGEVSREQLIALSQLPSDYEAWKIVGRADPEGELPDNDIQVTGSIRVKDGDRFRVVPSGTFGVFKR